MKKENQQTGDWKKKKGKNKLPTYYVKNYIMWLSSSNF